MRVQSLHIYPVKSTHAIDITEAAVETRGLAHDRRWMLTDTNGKFISQREQPGLAQVKTVVTPEGIRVSAPQQQDIFILTPKINSTLLPVTLWKNAIKAHTSTEAADQWFSTLLGITCRLVYQGDEPLPVSSQWGRPEDETSLSDGYPILITTTASLDDLNRRMVASLPMNRFRPNIVIDGNTPWAEDGWRTIRIGEIELEIVKPCTRCIVTTTDQETGEKAGSEPLSTLKTFRLVREPHLTGVVFGQNAVPRKLGMITVGDRVDIISARTPPIFLIP